MKKSKKKKMFFTIKKIGFFIFIITSLILLYFLHGIKSSKLLPNKYFMIILTVLLILDVIYLMIILLSRKRSFGIVLFSLFAILLSCGEMYALSNINYIKRFLKENLNIEYTVDVYYYIVNADSKYDDIDDVGKKKIYHYDSMDEKLLKESIKSDLSLSKESDYSTFLYNLLNDKNYVAIMHSSDYDSLIDNDEEYKDKIKVIGKFEVKQTIKKVITKEKPDLLKEPFVIYLSGIDTRSDSIPSRSLSDVNMILVVNPITHKVLMVSIPRDYYVQIAGTTGLKDKLTHAGMLGGIETSINTISNYMDVEFDYYIRVNFNAVINLVDAVGGININSDVNYSFYCWTDTSCRIYPGDNFVDGKCALAFARERHAYISGDIHRAENQQQVIDVLLNKLTSPGSVLKNYKSILKAMSGTFETNLSEDEILSLIRYQLDKMPSWKTESIVLDGYGDNLETYSYPNGKLSVMIPNEESVEKAKQRIQEFLEEK